MEFFVRYSHLHHLRRPSLKAHFYWLDQIEKKTCFVFCAHHLRRPSLKALFGNSSVQFVTKNQTCQEAMPSCTVNLDEKASANRHTGENGLHHFFLPTNGFVFEPTPNTFFSSSSLMTCFQANYNRSQMPHKKLFWDQIQTHAGRMKEAFCTTIVEKLQHNRRFSQHV